MTDVSGESFERRLLVLAPIGKDAALIGTMLRSVHVECRTCADVDELLRELERGAGAVLVAEEALSDTDQRLAAMVARQPAWSDLPILLLTRPGADSTFVERATSTLGNVTLLERPVRVVALASAIRSALRARARVEAHSEGIGLGSQFVVRLPLFAGVPVPEDVRRAGVPAFRGLTRVLVVDDNRDAADSLAALLATIGADARIAYDGESALDLLDAFQPAGVFLDLGMPDMDGYELARRIRSRPDARDTVLIALTGWGQERDRRRTEASGFTHHLAKPADLDTLQRVLSSLTRKPLHEVALNDRA